MSSKGEVGREGPARLTSHVGKEPWEGGKAPEACRILKAKRSAGGLANRRKAGSRSGDPYGHPTSGSIVHVEDAKALGVEIKVEIEARNGEIGSPPIDADTTREIVTNSTEIQHKTIEGFCCFGRVVGVIL